MKKDFSQRFQQGLFFLLLFLLPVQLGKHWWPQWSLVNGIRVDYLAPTIYLTDILAGFLIGSKIIEKLKKRQSFQLLKQRKWIWAIALLWLLQLFLVKAPWPHFYSLIKLLELGGLFWVLKQVSVSQQRQYWVTVIMLSGVCLLSLIQFSIQSSLGGWAYFLGERNFSKITPNIATSIIRGRVVLRPYASFSHPNSLAGFIMIGGWWLFFIWQDLIKRKIKPEWQTLTKTSFLIVACLIFLTLLTTWSRTAWVVGILAFVLWLNKLHSKRWLSIGVLSLGFLTPFLLYPLGYFLKTSFFQESLILRKQLLEIGWQLFIKQPLLGVGLKNFIPYLVEHRLALARAWLQPIHNIFWLTLVESGLIGGIIVGGIFYKTLQKTIQQKQAVLWLIITMIIFLGSNDHYWFTLQQNQLLLVFILASVWQKGEFYGK